MVDWGYWRFMAWCKKKKTSQRFTCVGKSAEINCESVFCTFAWNRVWNRFYCSSTRIFFADSQLARIDPELARQAGESTLAYLTRVRKKMPSLPVPLTHRIAYMHEAARFRPQVGFYPSDEIISWIYDWLAGNLEELFKQTKNVASVTGYSIGYMMLGCREG